MDLYQELILEHYKRPVRAGLRDPFEAEVHHVRTRAEQREAAIDAAPEQPRSDARLDVGADPIAGRAATARDDGDRSPPRGVVAEEPEATVVAVHPRFIAVGTARGVVVLFDPVSTCST